MDDHWSKLPKAWRDCFEDLPPEDLCFLLETGESTRQTVNRVWPLGLLALKQIFRELCVKRQQNCKVSSLQGRNKIFYRILSVL